MATEKRTLESSNTRLKASVFSAKLNSYFNSAEEYGFTYYYRLKTSSAKDGKR